MLVYMDKSEKFDDVEKYSDPKKVLKKAKKIYGKDVVLDVSTRKDKKYMILNPNTDKWVHFGQMNYEDYTKHMDEERRDKFLIRNQNWKDRPKYSPAYMAYFLLW